MTPAPAVPVAPDEVWQRLSPRMLLVHPARIAWSMAFPILLATFGISRGTEGMGWVWFALAGAVLAVVAGVVSWFITRYRFTDRQLQLRTGLLSRKVTTAPLDRIRSVDIESSPVHRVLGLATVKVGTGVDSSRIELDGLTREQAAQLRTYLLVRSGGPGHGGPPTAAAAPATDAAGAPLPEPRGTPYPGQAPLPAAVPDPAPADREELARIDWGWLRYAPFSLSSLVVVAGAFGVLAQFGDDLPVERLDVAQDAWAWVAAQAVLVTVAAAVVTVVLAWVVVSTASYVITWWNLRVVREPNGNLQVSRGLLTTHSQTLERAKVRGVSMGEPFLLRFVRGAELTAMATGIGAAGTTKVLPPAPRAVVTAIGHELLEEDGPLTMPLTGHGPRARRRIHVSHQWGTLVVAGLAAVPAVLPDRWWFVPWPWWVPLAVLGVLVPLNALVAESAWRNLGHGLSDRHLVVQTGAVVRTRAALETAGIIGWVLHQSFFQRRLGLGDLTATTAAGSESVVAPNIPVEVAVALARRATPGMLEDVLA
ncbi:PH domain-containing protein [Ornithinimicrobium sp. LYQ103]|uniref:PH domain-containing protein n=1 Tax=Ornithinimicrobium sp. LYQ103 TaxID=3378796 RepID=UPI003853D78C